MVGLLRYSAISSIISPHLPRIYRVKFYLTQVSRCRNFAICRRFTHVEPIRITRIFPIQFPATEKHTETGKNARFAYSLSEMQGWRLSESQDLLCFLCRACSPHAPFYLCPFLFRSVEKFASLKFFVSLLRCPDLTLACSDGRCTRSFVKSRRTTGRHRL